MKIGVYQIEAEPDEFERFDFICKIEDVWTAAQEYAKDNGLEYVGSYGVVNVAPT